MQDIHAQPALRKALQLIHQEPFTVAQFTRAYLDQPASPHTTQKAARQFVYRNILRLIRAGQLEKVPTSKGWPHYRVTDAYKESFASQITSVDEQTEPSTQSVAPPIKTVIGTLQRRLSQHKSDMLCAMGEAEEYSALCHEHPDLQEQAQELYNQARDRSAILLGKVKALESLLHQHARSS